MNCLLSEWTFCWVDLVGDTVFSLGTPSAVPSDVVQCTKDIETKGQNDVFPDSAVLQDRWHRWSVVRSRGRRV